MTYKTALMTVAAGALMASAAVAEPVNLRVQTHYASEHPTGKFYAQFKDDVETMSGGDITMEIFYSSSVVATTETFDANRPASAVRIGPERSRPFTNT